MNPQRPSAQSTGGSCLTSRGVPRPKWAVHRGGRRVKRAWSLKSSKVTGRQRLCVSFFIHQDKALDWILTAVGDQYLRVAVRLSFHSALFPLGLQSLLPLPLLAPVSLPAIHVPAPSLFPCRLHSSPEDGSNRTVCPSCDLPEDGNLVYVPQMSSPPSTVSRT